MDFMTEVHNYVFISHSGNRAFPDCSKWNGILYNMPEATGEWLIAYLSKG